jgi:hypothetical protein
MTVSCKSKEVEEEAEAARDEAEARSSEAREVAAVEEVVTEWPRLLHALDPHE